MRQRNIFARRNIADEQETKKEEIKPNISYIKTERVIHLSIFLTLLVVCVWVSQTVVDVVPRKQTLPWWQTTIVYQIYPRSFQDSDGDGVGDIKGIIQRLDYIQTLNVRAIWLNPFFRSPMKDFGYDISNYTDVDPIFGGVKDVENLLTTAHDKGIKVILDFVPNHSSDQHPWFQLSRRGVAPYRDYYIWTKGDKPPNNWKSLFRGSAWTRDEKRGELYYHAFLPQQPDLNWRCPHLVEEMKRVLRFWLDLGVDGFRVDAIQNLFENEDLTKNEPPSELEGIDEDDWYSLRHDFTFDSPDIGGAVRGWRDILDEYEAKDGVPRFLVVETLYDENVSIRNQYYSYGAHMPFNFDLLRINRSCGGHCFKHFVDRELGDLRPGQWPNFVVGNHDNPRIASKMGAEFVNAVNMLLLTLPGTPTTYYGEELGMADVTVPFYLGQDLQAKRQGEDYFRKYSRDPSRTPMQWNNKTHAGFTSGSTTWLPVRISTDRNNVEAQLKERHSPVQLYRRLARLRESRDFQEGRLQYAIVNQNILSYIRSTAPDNGHLVIINFGKDTSSDDYSQKSNDISRGVIVMTTENFKDEYYNTGNKVNLNKITLRPGQGLIIKLE